MYFQMLVVGLEKNSLMQKKIYKMRGQILKNGHLILGIILRVLFQMQETGLKKNLHKQMKILNKHGQQQKSGHLMLGIVLVELSQMLEIGLKIDSKKLGTILQVYLEKWAISLEAFGILSAVSFQV